MTEWMAQVVISSSALGMTAPETWGATAWVLTSAWKPDHLIVLSSTVIINIFIKIIAEKSPGLLNTGGGFICQWFSLQLITVLSVKQAGPHDRLIAHLCREKKCHCLVTTTTAPLFQPRWRDMEETVSRWGAAKNTCCTCGTTNQSSKNMCLPLLYDMQIKSTLKYFKAGRDVCNLTEPLKGHGRIITMSITYLKRS